MLHRTSGRTTVKVISENKIATCKELSKIRTNSKSEQLEECTGEYRVTTTTGRPKYLGVVGHRGNGRRTSQAKLNNLNSTLALCLEGCSGLELLDLEKDL